jgi:hypothetical protein
MPFLASILVLALRAVALQDPAPPAGQQPPAPAQAAPTGTPATQPAATPAPPAKPAIEPAPPAPAPATPPTESTAPATPAPAAEAPRQVWIFIDRWKEFGGTVTADTDLDITVYDGHETRTFRKAKVLDVIEIVHPKPGQRGLVQLRDGTVVRGEIIRDTLEEVEFKVDTVQGKLPRSQVYRVVLEMDFDARYARIKASISPEEHGRRLGLARWLTDQGRLDLAITELEALLRDADIEEARDMLRDVNARVKLAQAVEVNKRSRAKPAPEAGNTASTPGTAPGADPATGPARTGDSKGTATAEAPKGPPTSREMLPKDLLSNADVNLVRVYEIDFKDPPRMTVSPEGVRQLILRYGSSALVPADSQARNALYSKSGTELAHLLFDLKARDLYGYIEVDEDPASIAKFRTRVHNSWLIGNCATSRCHGGVDAGRFFLYTGNAKDQRIRYTNLLTLLNFKVDGKPMVNFEDPPNSLLIQYAMPRTTARYPHPDVKGWKPIFGNSTPQLMQDTLDWIRSMYQPRPEYPVKYIPPNLEAPDRATPGTGGPDR